MAANRTSQLVFEGAGLEILRRAPLVHVGVQGALGPHVTPQGFVWFMDRIWVLTPRNSFKAKVLSKRREAGLLMEHDGRHLYVGGRATVLDPLDPASLLADPGAAAILPVAFAAYMKKNVYESISAARRRFGIDVLGMPATCVAVAVKPERSALLGPQGLIDGAGDWSGQPAGSDGAPTDELDLDELPDELREMAVRGKHLAVVGWGGSGPPLVFPACWDGNDEKAEADRALLDLAMAPSNADACITIDNEIGPGLDAKRGVVLRGPGISTFEDGKATIALDATKVHFWEGKEAQTFEAGASE